MRTRLQEATEVGKVKKNYNWYNFVRLLPNWLSDRCFWCVNKVIDVLCSDLEVAHRYLEGKYEALKILQSKVERHTQIAATHIIATIVQMELQTPPPKQQMKQTLTVASWTNRLIIRVWSRYLCWKIGPIYFDRYWFDSRLLSKKIQLKIYIITCEPPSCC